MISWFIAVRMLRLGLVRVRMRVRVRVRVTASVRTHRRFFDLSYEKS
jgi:hypothetical protein